MKLSEAMRLGALLGPQAFGQFITKDGGGCAMGAAIQACSGAAWPVLLTYATCPACGEKNPAGAIIMHLNDDHRWTREQIADWVQTVEEREAERTASPTSADAVAVSVGWSQADTSRMKDLF